VTARRIDAIAVLLVVATALSWWLGETAEGGRALGQGAVLAVLALAGFKGALITLDFMELRFAPATWRRAVLVWLLLVTGLIAVVSVGLQR
jgi:hypothetical protein